MNGGVVTIPSGVPVGDISPGLLAVLDSRYDYRPLFTMAIIEEGSYADFKACVFRVCSLMAFNVMMDDLGKDLYKEGLRIHSSSVQRQWCYTQDDDYGNGCATVIELTMEAVAGSFNVEDVLMRLGCYYGFIHDKLSIDRRSAVFRFGPHERYYAIQPAQPTTVSVRLIWRHWT